jgi:hypothetical protein
MKTLINIFGTVYYLWIKGAKDRETGEYQDFYQAWENGDLLNMAFHITAEEDKDAPRVAFEDNQIVLLPREEQGSVFGYIWCTKKGMEPRGTFAHGLVGMRYGWEKARETVFSDASSLEFSWRQAVSKRVWQYMEWKSKQMKAPAPMQKPLEDKPELFKTKIADLTFREKMQRYLRKPTTKVYAAITEEFSLVGLERQEDIIEKLRTASVSKQKHIAELLEQFMVTCQQCTSDDARNQQEEELPAGL